VPETLTVVPDYDHTCGWLALWPRVLEDLERGAGGRRLVRSPIYAPARTTWVHEFQDNQRVIYFRFRDDLGQTKLLFQTHSPDRNYANLGTGVVLVLPKGMQVFLSFRALVGYSDRQAYTANGGLRIGF
jgi:uncharacterized protein with beta-barrel porin domain